MHSECIRIADQLRRAYSGDAWHGDPLSKLLEGVTAEEAYGHPVPSAHSIWELVLHIELYAHIAVDATNGVPMPRLYETGKDWHTVSDNSAAAWREAVRGMFETAARLAQAVEHFTDERLKDIVPGREYDFYHLFHGIVQHSLYHGGQIAMLRRAVMVGAG
jgi:uncharacterized damage-inducible protein DinB